MDSPWSGSCGQQQVDPGLELVGDATERESRLGRSRRATTADGRPATEHQRPPVVVERRSSRSMSSRGFGLLDRGGLGQDLRVQRGGGQQLGMGAVGHDPPAVEKDDPIGQADGREAVRHNQGGPILHEHTQAGVDPLLHLDVDGARGVVEDQDGRVDQEGPGDGDALALSSREGVARARRPRCRIPRPGAR